MSRVPDIDYLRVFGCKAYVNVPKKKQSHKFKLQSLEMTFVGYEPNSKGYRLWDKNTQTIKVSTDITFDESSFPGKPNIIALPAPNPSDQVSVQLPIPVPSSDNEDDDDSSNSSDQSGIHRSPRNRPGMPFASPTGSSAS